MTRIKSVELHEFEFDAVNLDNLTGAKTIGAVGYAEGGVTRLPKYAVVIETEDGCRGEYVTHWVGSGAALAQSRMLAPKLIGRHAEQRSFGTNNGFAGNRGDGHIRKLTTPNVNPPSA